MAMGSSGGGEGLSSEINVTPLIDVLLVLLIIFMITQPLSRKAFDVQVPPEQQQKSKQPPSAQIVLELLPDGGYAINKQPYSRDQLGSTLPQLYENRPAKRIFIKAAPNRQYADPADVMANAHGAGGQVIAFTPPNYAGPRGAC